MTLVSLSHHCLGPNVCSSIPDSGTLFTHFMGTCSATAGLVMMGDSPLPNMQSHVLSPFNCLSQRANSLFNFLGITKQLSMYPGVLLLLESVFKKKPTIFVCITHRWEGHNIFWSLTWFSFPLTRYWNGTSSIMVLFDPHWEGCVCFASSCLGTVGLLLSWERKLMWTWKSHWEPSI